MKNQTWDVQKSQYLVKNKHLKVREDKCKSLRGKKLKYYVVERQNGAGVVAITKTGKVILQRQYRHPHKEWVVQIPAGNINKKESAFTTAKRELLEESGYKASRLVKLSDFYPTSSVLNNTMTLYLGINAQKVSDPNLDKGEDLETFEVSIQKAVKMVQNGEIKDTDSALAILSAYKHIKENYPELQHPFVSKRVK